MNDERLAKARATKVARAEQYRAHVAELAGANDVTIDERASSGGRAIPTLRHVSIGAVRGVSSYYVALHEIGHCVMRGRSLPRLENEAAAWQWAIDHAMTPPTPGVRKMIRRCLGSYHARHVRMAARRYVRFPPAGHVFYSLAETAPPWPDYDGRSIKL